ncbi:MAG: arylsulfatase [Geminicoccaceae bacterium]|nr:arylsulfatase [Geminicoccaceae bacterium]
MGLKGARSGGGSWDAGLYHLNAYTYADPTWFPDMDPELRAMFARVTKGSFFDGYVEKDYLDRAAGSAEPFFMSVNFMKVHQPNLPATDYIHKSLSKSKYADSVVELDARIGRIMDKVRALGLDQKTLVFYTTDNGAWQDVYPDAGYTPFRGTKGTVREGGNRVPAIAWMPGKIPAGKKNHDIVGGLDLMATFAAVAGIKLPEKDRSGEPIIFDSYDMSPVLFGTGKVGADLLVLLHRGRADAGRRARRQLQGGSICGAMTASRPAASRSTPIRAGRVRRNTSPRCPRSSISGRIRRSATTSS